MIYALDTNIVTLLLKDDEIVNRNASVATANNHTLIIPKIVDYEVRRGLLARRMAKKLRQYLNFRQTVSVAAIDDIVWDKAVEVYAVLSQRGKTICDDDVIIAAFCLVNGYTLVTNNTRHFENIDSLQVENWKS